MYTSSFEIGLVCFNSDVVLPSPGWYVLPGLRCPSATSIGSVLGRRGPGILPWITIFLVTSGVCQRFLRVTVTNENRWQITPRVTKTIAIYGNECIILFLTCTHSLKYDGNLQQERNSYGHPSWWHRQWHCYLTYAPERQILKSSRWSVNWAFLGTLELSSSWLSNVNYHVRFHGVFTVPHKTDFYMLGGDNAVKSDTVVHMTSLRAPRNAPVTIECDEFTILISRVHMWGNNATANAIRMNGRMNYVLTAHFQRIWKYVCM